MGRLLLLVYRTVSVISKVVFWRSSMAAADRKKLNQLMKKASSVLGCPVDTVEVVGDGRVMAKLSSLMNHTSCPMHDTLSALHSSFSHQLIPPRV